MESDDEIRIISMRKADRDEVNLYSAPLQVVEFFNIFPEISKNAL